MASIRLFLAVIMAVILGPWTHGGAAMAAWNAPTPGTISDGKSLGSISK